MSSDPSNDNKNLPPWLRDVPLPPEPRGTDMAAKPRAPQPNNLGAPAAEAGLPEWLRELGDDTPSAPAPAATPSAPPASSLPEWLRELGDDTPSAPASAPAPLPEWLRDTAPGTPPANAAPLPDWLSNISDPDATALPPSAEPADTTLPGWLQAAQSEAPHDAPPLDSLNQPAPIEPAEPADADMPNWLRNLSETDAAAPEPPQAEAAPMTPEPPADDSLPSWLREPPADSDSPDTLAPFSFDEPTDSQQPAPASPPSWLARDLDPSDEGTPSWLGAASAAPDDQAPASDIPLWLQDRAEDATSNPPPEPAAEPAAQLPELTPSDTPLPSWLQSSSAAPAADELPEWLRNTDAPAMPAAPPPPPQPAPLPAQPAPAADELPEWLRDTSSAAIPSDQPGAEIPAWLHDAPTQAPAGLSLPADDSAQPAANAEDAEIPAWLRDVPAGAAEPPPPATSGASTAAGELPAWLQPAELPANVADDLPPWLRDEAGAPLPNAGSSGEGNLPSWLRGASATPPVSPLDSPPTPVDANTDNGRDAEATPAAELVGGVELPAWLRPAETEPSKDEITPTDARSLDWLTRLGAQEDEETEAASAAPAIRLTPPALPTRSPAQIEAIALLEQLAAEPFPTPTPAPELARPSIWRRIGVERLLYLALLLAVVAALLLPPPDILGIGGPPVAPGADDLFKQIGGLSANDIVLVGYEWDARRSGELRPLEQAVVDHLIQQRVKLVLISTDSQGSLLLYDLRDRLEAAGYQPRGEDYILLGYKPGAELALRSLAQDFPSALRSDFQGNDASGSLLATTPDRQLRLKTLSDFSLVLVLGDDAADVQGWMEQARTSARRADGSYVPFGFVLPAETEPIVQPYLNQPNVLHLAGKQGALAYQQLRGATGMPAAQIAAEVGQQRFSQLLYLALLLIGAIVVAIHSAVRRGRNQP